MNTHPPGTKRISIFFIQSVANDVACMATGFCYEAGRSAWHTYILITKSISYELRFSSFPPFKLYFRFLFYFFVPCNVFIDYFQELQSSLLRSGVYIVCCSVMVRSLAMMKGLAASTTSASSATNGSLSSRFELLGGPMWRRGHSRGTSVGEKIQAIPFRTSAGKLRLMSWGQILVQQQRSEP